MKKLLNIVLGFLFVVTVVLLVWAIATAGSDMAISANLIWGYILLVGGAVTAVWCAIKGMVKNPTGIKTTLLAALLVVVVVGAALGIAFSHEGLRIPNAEGGFFEDPMELIITESSIIVTYAAFAFAVVAALYSEIRNALK